MLQQQQLKQPQQQQPGQGGISTHTHTRQIERKVKIQRKVCVCIERERERNGITAGRRPTLRTRTSGFQSRQEEEDDDDAKCCGVYVCVRFHSKVTSYHTTRLAKDKRTNSVNVRTGGGMGRWVARVQQKQSIERSINRFVDRPNLRVKRLQ